MRDAIPWSRRARRKARLSVRGIIAAGGDGALGGVVGLGIWRRRLALLGLVGLMGLASVGRAGVGAILAEVTLVSLAGATALAWVEVRALRRGGVVASGPRVEPLVPAGGEPVSDLSGTYWGRRLAPAAAVLIALAAVQSWFTPGTAIAGGDLAPPNGTAWLGQIFAPWGWSGSDLGRPASLETQLPWAAILWLVHNAGGSAALAQQIWFSLLFCGAAICAYALLRLLCLSPLAALCGSLVYVFNPYVLSTAGTNPVFLAALTLVPLVAAIFLAVASGRWHVRTGTVWLLATVPLLGFAYENPPLILAVAFSMLGALLLGALLYGRNGGRRAARTFAIGVPLLALGSLYWVVPSLAQLHALALHQLGTVASWTWTEGRATLANAFWLNTSWAWRFSEYVPYAGQYSQFPLALLKFGPPILGFTALALPYGRDLEGRSHRLIVVASASSVALVFVFLSTGTNFPGSLLFDPLYSLPYGWLLQEPGRFLGISALGYAVLGSVTIDAVASALAVEAQRRHNRTPRLVARLSAPAFLVALAVVVPGYPLASGAIVSGPRADHMPSNHVQMPVYWSTMTTYLNDRSTPAGNLLVLPPDDFYQMPYTWYYGNDGFITDMVSRHVVDPVGQGYGPAPGQLQAAVGQVASSLLAGRTLQANRLLEALGTPDILVRGDVIATFPGRHIDSPRALGRALARDPAVRLVRRSGPLELFRLQHPGGALHGVQSGVAYATVNAASPNLAELALFARRRVLVYHRPTPGVPAVYQLPPLSRWHVEKGALVVRVPLVPGEKYSSALLGSSPAHQGRARLVVGARPVALGPFTVGVSGSKRAPVAVARLPLATQLARDGSFQKGPWGRVGDCNDVLGAAAKPYLHAQAIAHVGPGRQPALRLSASEDSACMSERLQWRRGPVLLQLYSRELTGSPPSLCVWEVGPDTCASLPPLPSSGRWQAYRTVVDPSPATRALDLFLYAQAPSQGVEAVDEYARIGVWTVVGRVWTPPVIVALPGSAVPDRIPFLTTQVASYSRVWHAGSGAHQVLVDGLMNGWLAPNGIRVVPQDSLAPALTAAFIATAAAGLLGLVLLGSVPFGTVLERRRKRVATALEKGERPRG